MNIYGGVVVSQQSNQIVMVNEDDQVISSRVLMNDLRHVSKALKSTGSTSGHLAITGDNIDWLVNGLMKTAYKAYVSGSGAEVKYRESGFINGKWNAEWLAHALFAQRLSIEYFYMARFDSTLPSYVVEQIHGLHQLVTRMFGKKIAEQYDDSLNEISLAQNCLFTIEDGDIHCRPYNLDLDKCRTLMNEARDFAIKSVGRENVVNQILETNSAFVAKMKHLAPELDPEILSNNKAYLEILEVA